MPKIKKRYLVLLFIAVASVGIWLYAERPFKITDPTDPRFDISKVRAYDFDTRDEMIAFIKQVFPQGLPRDEVERRIKAMNGYAGNETKTDVYEPRHTYIYIAFSCGYEFDFANWLCAPFGEGFRWRSTVEYDQQDRLFEFYLGRHRGVYDSRRLSHIERNKQ